MPPDLSGWLTVLGPPLAIYVAIRVDLALAKKTADDAHASAKDAHGRIDDHINVCHVKGAGHA